MASKTRHPGTGTASESGSSSGSRLKNLRERTRDKTLGWDAGDPELMARTIERVTRHGALISFSRTLEGGACCLYIKDGDASDKAYFAHEGEIDAYLLQLYEEYA